MALLEPKTLTEITTQALEFPDSDGKPLGETGIHVNQILDLLAALKWYFRGRANVYCGADMFVYFDPTNPRQNFCPDVFVVLDVHSDERRSWKSWVEGKLPDFIIEITSKGTRREDTRHKRALYEKLGVREYFLFDPLEEYLRPRLQGFRLVGGTYEPLPGRVLTSQVLGLELRVKEDDDRLHLFDPRRGEWLLTPKELAYYAEKERVRAEGEFTRAEVERARREAAEAEVRRLQEELARLRGEVE